MDFNVLGIVCNCSWLICDVLIPTRIICNLAGVCPVCILYLLGAQTGAAAYALEKHIPCLASNSRLGVS